MVLSVESMVQRQQRSAFKPVLTVCRWVMHLWKGNGSLVAVLFLLYLSPLAL